MIIQYTIHIVLFIINSKLTVYSIIKSVNMWFSKVLAVFFHLALTLSLLDRRLLNNLRQQNIIGKYLFLQLIFIYLTNLTNPMLFL